MCQFFHCSNRFIGGPGHSAITFEHLLIWNFVPTLCNFPEFWNFPKLNDLNHSHDGNNAWLEICQIRPSLYTLAEPTWLGPFLYFLHWKRLWKVVSIENLGHKQQIMLLVHFVNWFIFIHILEIHLYFLTFCKLIYTYLFTFCKLIFIYSQWHIYINLCSPVAVRPSISVR